jgi:cytochrome b6-f complex iron-sulfur subunit
MSRHIVVAQAASVDRHAIRPGISRRGMLRLAFWTSVAAASAGVVASIVNAVYPRGVTGFGGPVRVPSDRIPRPGDAPRPIVDGRFLLVNLAPGEGLADDGSASTPGGLLALYRKCPHLGCTVPWQADARAKNDDRTGFFLCPCHQSTYTKAGVRVFGPAPRSMDTMLIEPTATGIIVQTGAITPGDAANPQRAIPWPS